MKTKTTILLRPFRPDGGENKDLYLIDLSDTTTNCRELRFPGDAYSRAGHAIVGSYAYFIGGLLLEKQSFCTNTIRRLNLQDPNTELEIFKLPFYCYAPRTVVVGDLIYIFVNRFPFLPSSDSRQFPIHWPNNPGWGYIWDTKNQIGKYLEGPNSLGPVHYSAALDEIRVLIFSFDTCFVHNSTEDKWEEWENLKFPDYNSSLIWSHAVSDDGRILYLFWTSEYGKGFLSSYNLVTGGHLCFKLEIPTIEKRCWFPDGYCACSGALLIDSVQLVALDDGKLCFFDYSADRKGNKLCYTRIALAAANEAEEGETVDLVIEEENLEFDVQAIVEFVF